MKRAKYNIYLDGNYVAVKYKWNTARHRVTNLMKERLEVGETIKLTSVENFKNDDGEFVCSIMTWTHENGTVYTVEIKKETSE